MIPVASWILWQFFIILTIAAATVTSQENSTDLFTTEEVITIGKSIEESSRDAVASSLSEKCIVEQSEARAFHIFFYTCMYDKEANALMIHALENAWSFCCSVQNHCPRNVSEADCRDIYCDCLDLVNIVHQPFRDSCKPTQLSNTCKGQTQMSVRHRTALSLEDVGFAKTFKKNLILGSYGWGCFLAVVFAGLASMSYTVISYIHYKCNHKPAVEAAMAVAYQAEAEPVVIPDENNPNPTLSNETHTVGSVSSVAATPNQPTPMQSKSNEHSFVETLMLK